MATHLGRNPFQNKPEKSKRSPEPIDKEVQAETKTDKENSSSESIFVKVPAASAVLALKTLFFVKGLIQKE